MWADPVDFFFSLRRDYGDIAYFEIDEERLYVLNRAEFARDVFVTYQDDFLRVRQPNRAFLLTEGGLLGANGDEHLRQRVLGQPAFTREEVAATVSELVKRTTALSEKWEGVNQIELHSEMVRLLLGALVALYFGYDLGERTAALHALLEKAIRFVDVSMSPWTRWWETMRFKRVSERIHREIDVILKSRPPEGGDRFLVDRLIRGRTGDWGQLRREALTYLIAGYDTISTLLAWTFQLLSSNPAKRQRLQEEVDRVPAEDVASLVYCRWIIREALRLYPPAWHEARHSLRAFQADEYVVPENSTVLITQAVLHRDPRYFEEPESFRPERWDTPNEKPPVPYSYYPFGLGKHHCIAENFSVTAAVVILATLAKRWELSSARTEPLRLQNRAGILRARGGFPMQLTRR